MKIISLLLILCSFCSVAQAQLTLSLDSCRALALRNNKQLLISGDQIEAAEYEHKAARTNYLPKVSADASYIYNARTVHLLSKDQRNTLNNLGTNRAGSIKQVAQAIIQQFPDLQPLIEQLGSGLGSELNQIGNTITNALETNTHNVYAGSLMLTQPLYMGGRIKAYDNITNYTKTLLGNQYNSMLQKVILETDQAYWQVVSLANKKNLAENYVEMLRKLDGDVQKMYKEGMVNKASTLNVAVKLNEAEMTLTKVENGLSLSKMLLCQICGIPINDAVTLKDENAQNLETKGVMLLADTTQAYNNRSDLKALEQATKIAEENVKIVRSVYMPQLGLFGAYTLTNPNIYNGFSTRFGGNMSVGVALHVPLWRWNESKYRISAAKVEARAAGRLYDEVKEKINLQLSQAKYKAQEANKNLATAEKNIGKAEENLHCAQVGFKEGVISATDLLAAQTAWLQAQTQKIDAQIEIKLTEATLVNVMGKESR